MTLLRISCNFKESKGIQFMNTNTAISNAFSNLAGIDTLVYDYWVGKLYTLDGAMIDEEWNETNLKFMEDDVMNLSNI